MTYQFFKNGKLVEETAFDTEAAALTHFRELMASEIAVWQMQAKLQP